MYDKVSAQLEFLEEDFENRNSIQEEFIQSLLFTLKKHGITEFEFDDNVEESNDNEKNNEVDINDNLEYLDEIEEEEKPPLKNYPWWRPSKSMTTIMEEDESCEADDEG